MTNKDPNLIKTPIDDIKRDTNKDPNQIDNETTVNKGTTTLENDVYDSEHVKDGDNPARQPDRRDQTGQTPFDHGINDDSSKISEQPQSQEISERNRYASIDNAQTRVLPEEDIKPTK